MKITVYTTTDCQYSKQEKDYLTANKLQYEEKNLETNKEFLTEMMAISNNFAGTPVTRVEKDDGSIVVLKGFTKEEFDASFGFAAATQPKVVEPAVTTVPPAVKTPIVEAPAPTPPPTETVVAAPSPVPTETKSDELNSVLGKLEEKTEPVTQVPTPAETAPTPPEASPPATTPVETPPTDAPSVPDFPADAKTTV